MWFVAYSKTTGSGGQVAVSSVLALVVPCVEWLTFVAAHGSAQSTATHWKETQEDTPWLQRVMFRNSFRNPLGIFVMISIFGLPIVIYAKAVHEALPFIPLMAFFTPLLDLLFWSMVAGRLLGMTIESYVIRSHLRRLLLSDATKKQ